MIALLLPLLLTRVNDYVVHDSNRHRGHLACIEMLFRLTREDEATRELAGIKASFSGWPRSGFNADLCEEP